MVTKEIRDKVLRGQPDGSDTCEGVPALSLQFSHSVVSDSLRTPWNEACQTSLSIINSRSLLKLIKSIKSVMPSNYFILCRPLLLLPSVFPSIRVFSNGQSIGVSASASVPPMNIQDWFPLGWTGWISLQGLSRLFSSTLRRPRLPSTVNQPQWYHLLHWICSPVCLPHWVASSS